MAEIVVCGHLFAPGPADIMSAGGLSHYGTMGQNGNVREWAESAFDGSNDSAAGDSSVVRGGHWSNSSGFLTSSTRFSDGPISEGLQTGFRVVVVPEPSKALLTVIGAFGLLTRRKRG